ncbi:MAG: trypsin-like serine protease [Actinobacteria bacterium]|nr:trypsin-like serine protease [Actinomycetota bacterium]
MLRRRSVRAFGLIALLATLTAVLGWRSIAQAPAVSAEPAGTAQSQTADPLKTVGSLFRDGADGPHNCTASVIDSPTHDLILTAAHCISGSGVGMQFAPGYDQGATPYGVWTVTAAYVDAAWMDDQDPHYDYAILRVADQNLDQQTVGVQDVVGGAILAPAPPAGTQITDLAYNSGIDDDPITCTVSTYETSGYPSFNCSGFVDGSSGSPWMMYEPGSPDPFVVGVIGGLNQGGCVEYTSYSSPFDEHVFQLLVRAADGAAPDTIPTAGDSGC